MSQIKQLSLLVLITLSMALAGCGGGSDTTTPPVTATPPVQQKATVTVLLTDAPTDEFGQIFVTITAIELLGGDATQSLFSGEQRVDLLALESFSDLFAVSDDVDPGTYEKIRLSISNLELVRLDDNGDVVDIEYPPLPANGRIDLNPRGDFTIAAGDNVVVQLDLDANRSIQVVSTGNGGYRFRPVVFVDILASSLDGKNVRVNGAIVAISDDGKIIEVCQQAPTSSSSDDDADSEACVDVVLNDMTGLFDADGLPVDASGLAIGDVVTVIGRFELTDDDNRLVAQVVMIGADATFLRIDGLALGAVDADNRFSLAVGPGQGFATDTTLSVLLAPLSRIVDAAGESVGADAIAANTALEAEGVLVLNDVDNDTLRAAYLVLGGSDGAGDEIQLSGQVQSVNSDDRTLIVTDATGDRCVVTSDATRVFQVASDGDATVSLPLELTDLMAGDAADIYGIERNDGCFEAAVIIVGAAT